VTDKLDVKHCHLNFLNKHSKPLDDAPVPISLEPFPEILSAISDRQQALLSMPESWREALYKIDDTKLSLILALDDGAYPSNNTSRFSFAKHVGMENDDDHANT
jgi:hypothetical protein